MKTPTEMANDKPRLQLRYYDVLGRSVFSTKKGTCRLFSLVSVQTLAQHEAWRAQNKMLTSGQMIDLLTKFAVENGFKVS